VWGLVTLFIKSEKIKQQLKQFKMLCALKILALKVKKILSHLSEMMKFSFSNTMRVKTDLMSLIRVYDVISIVHFFVTVKKSIDWHAIHLYHRTNVLIITFVCTRIFEVIIYIQLEIKSNSAACYVKS